MLEAIGSIIHPEYASQQLDWEKFRLTYESGYRFRDRYLQKYSVREDDAEFKLRQRYTPVPSFAKAAANDIKNSIFARMMDIVRAGGAASYQSVVNGENGGVDFTGKSMNTFIGQSILPELLVIGKVGAFVDKPQNEGPLLSQTYKNRPYLYMYRAEAIHSWTLDTKKNFTQVLLSEAVEDYDINTGLPTGTVIRYRRAWIGNDGYVHLQFYNEEGEEIWYYPTVMGPIANDGDLTEIILPLREIPFVVFEMSESILTDIADYQIALMNLLSANLYYAYRSNFPFYVEQFDPKSENIYTRPPAFNESRENPTLDPDQVTNEGVEIHAQQGRTRNVTVGPSSGRRYPVGTERPGFIHPSSEPLKASMELSDQMKAELRQLLNLTLSALEPKFASAESKDRDQRGLESGLHHIGLELENGERRIGHIWSLYEGANDPSINYPKHYSFKSDEDRRKEAEGLDILRLAIPSRTGQKAIAKQIADILLRGKVSVEDLQKIMGEIEKAKYLSSDANEVAADVNLGLVSTETASEARGYDAASEVAQAKKDHAERIARVAAAQTPGQGAAAAGVPDLSATPTEGSLDQRTIRKDITRNFGG